MADVETTYTAVSELSSILDGDVASGPLYYNDYAVSRVGRDTSFKADDWSSFAALLENVDIPADAVINWAKITVEGHTPPVSAGALEVKWGLGAKDGFWDGAPAVRDQRSHLKWSVPGPATVTTHAWDVTEGFPWGVSTTIYDPSNLVAPHCALKCLTSGSISTIGVPIIGQGTPQPTITFWPKVWELTSGDPGVTWPPTLSLKATGTPVAHPSLGTIPSPTVWFTLDGSVSLTAGTWYAVSMHYSGIFPFSDSTAMWGGGSQSRGDAHPLGDSAVRWIEDPVLEPRYFNKHSTPYAGTFPLPISGVASNTLIPGQVFAEAPSATIPSPGVVADTEYSFGDGGSPTYSVDLTTMLQAWIDDVDYVTDAPMLITCRCPNDIDLQAGFKGIGDGSAYALRLTVNYTLSEPTVDSFTAVPLTITAGDTVDLSWTTTDATTSVVIDNGIGPVAEDGTVETPPLFATTTYTITATGPGGVATDQVTVTVIPVPTIDSFTADQLSVFQGRESLLSWETTDTSSVSIDNGIGAVTEDGSQTTGPLYATVTYTLTAQNSLGYTVYATVTITVVYDSQAINAPFLYLQVENAGIQVENTKGATLAVEQGPTVATDGQHNDLQVEEE